MNPILQAMETLSRNQERRHAWLLKAGEQIRKDNLNLSRSVGRDSNRLTGDRNG